MEKKFGNVTFKPVDLATVAQNVGRPDRSNCGTCHFYGGGGDGIKHGDLDSSLIDPGKTLDVHMDSQGLNFQCTSCHTTLEHQIAGRIYCIPAPAYHRIALPKDYGNRISCESCHSARPHEGTEKLNDHTDKVACQTCHIPTFARGGKATMMSWDWSNAGHFQSDGQPIVKKDESGNVTYHTKKGEMRWAEEVVPDYFWYNGKLTYLRIGESFGDRKTIEINHIQGDHNDPESRIFPFKIHRGRQVYDKVNKSLVVPHLFGKKGTGAYWADYDWVKSCEIGMRGHQDVKFSGDVDFIDTVMYWPISHMITPKEDSLSCDACHNKQGLLRNLAGFYMPGRDCCSILDVIGWGIVILTLLGVIIHGSVRVYCRKKGVTP